MQKHAFRRVIKSGYLSFRRNDWLSTATIIIMLITLLILGSMVFVGAFASTVLRNFESKIDISVYMKPEAPEQSIFAVQKELESIPSVAEVSYVSKEQALADFKNRHKNNALIYSALDELGENPLEASLNVRATKPSEYAAINDFLTRKNYAMVDKVNYSENQMVIERFGSILGTVRSSGAIVLLLLAFVAILVAFNTIRLAIYTMREEIGIMRLVGASTWFVRGPFLFAGVMYGAIAALVAIAVFFPVAWFLSPKIGLLVPEFDLYGYFLANFAQFSGMMFLSGVSLGVFSSFIAIRKYLRI